MRLEKNHHKRGLEEWLKWQECLHNKHKPQNHQKKKKEEERKKERESLGSWSCELIPE
jgi:hypothetical protein